MGIRSLAVVSKFVRHFNSWLRGYRLFIVIVLALLAVLISLSLFSPADDGFKPRNKRPDVHESIEHRSADWYGHHTYSDGRSIPLNKANTGIYIEKLYSLELAKNSFRARGYIWSKWNGALLGWDKQPWPKQDPLDGVYMNTLNKHDSSLLGENYTYTSDHRWHYVYRLFDAEFESHFNFRKYPFDRQTLVLRFFNDGDAAVIRNYIDRAPRIICLLSAVASIKLPPKGGFFRTYE